MTAAIGVEAPPRVGATFTTTRRIGRTERTLTQRITHLEEPRVWRVRGIDGPLRFDVLVVHRHSGGG